MDQLWAGLLRFIEIAAAEPNRTLGEIGIGARPELLKQDRAAGG
jgi:hypothetical protein